MNTSDGTIQVFDTPEKLAEERKRRAFAGEPPLRILKHLPKPKCRKCYGKGNLGINLLNGIIVPCKCVL